MLALARIGVFVKMRTVEVAEPDLVLWEMRGHPIENYSNAALVKVVHEVHKIRWSAKPAGGSEIPGNLIAPGSIERMLHDRHQLDMSETGVVEIIGENRSHLTIAEPPIPFLGNAPPRSKMSLID